MPSKRNECQELEEAKNNFHMYHQMVNTRVYPDLWRTNAGLTERPPIRVYIDGIAQRNGRVLVFRLPSRPIGMPIQFEGACWMPSGEDLGGMAPDQLKHIPEEAVPDLSAVILPDATLEHFHLLADHLS